jgi:hypothetical protein
MTEKILLIGDDALLIKTRALVLSEWSPVTATSLEAPDVLAKQRFELVIIGQSVSEDRVASLLKQVSSANTHPRLLLLRFPGELNRFMVETHDVQLLLDPRWLRNRVTEILTSGQEPIQDVFENVQRPLRK